MNVDERSPEPHPSGSAFKQRHLRADSNAVVVQRNNASVMDARHLAAAATLLVLA